MSALTLCQSGGKLMKTCRRLPLHNSKQPTLIQHHFQHHHQFSVACASRVPFTGIRSAPVLPVLPEPNPHTPFGSPQTSRHLAIQTRSVSSSTIAESEPLAQIQALLPPPLLEDLSTLWFQHIVNDQDLVVPSQDSMMHWFRKDEAFDQVCSTKFGQALEQIKTLRVTGEAILDALQPSSPLQWIQLIILLDQMPRNIYRGEESRIVFTVFDPIAQHIAQAATAAGVYRHPLVRYRIGHRLWFNMPLMHSEDRVMHQRAVELIESMTDDVKDAAVLQEDLGNSADDEIQEMTKCKAIIASNRDAAVKLCESQMQFEVKHKVIIDKFGRYPHRNGPLGRQMTTDEQEFLDGGGDTFGS